LSTLSFSSKADQHSGLSPYRSAAYFGQGSSYHKRQVAQFRLLPPMFQAN